MERIVSGMEQEMEDEDLEDEESVPQSDPPEEPEAERVEQPEQRQEQVEERLEQVPEESEPESIDSQEEPLPPPPPSQHSTETISEDTSTIPDQHQRIQTTAEVEPVQTESSEDNETIPRVPTPPPEPAVVQIMSEIMPQPKSSEQFGIASSPPSYKRYLSHKTVATFLFNINCWIVNHRI